MRTLTCATVFMLAVGCAPAADAPEPLPVWSFEAGMVFPADHSLTRPEDGIALADGRIIVAGFFDSVNGVPHRHIARSLGKTFQRCDAVALMPCFSYGERTRPHPLWRRLWVGKFWRLYHCLRRGCRLKSRQPDKYSRF